MLVWEDNTTHYEHPIIIIMMMMMMMIVVVNLTNAIYSHCKFTFLKQGHEAVHNRHPFDELLTARCAPFAR